MRKAALPEVKGKYDDGDAWEKEAQELRNDPGEWYIIMSFTDAPLENYRSRASDIKRGKMKVFRPAGSFDARTRVEWEDGKKVLNVYARYVGDPDE